MLGKLQEKVWHRKWTDSELDKYIGQHEKSYLTYATDPITRESASSGGSVSALLIHLLETSKVQGALVLRTIIKEGYPEPEFFIATTREEVLAARGSKYSAVYFARDAFPLIKAFEGTLAVVALPCDATILHHQREKTPELAQKVPYIITLFCGHNSEPELAREMVDKLRPKVPNVELVDYVYRFGHWRGKLSATYSDGTHEERPFAYFSDYRNLYFFTQRKCHNCFDHFGYNCDISAGDIWSPQMKKEPIKHTALITRSAIGAQLVEDAIHTGALHAEEIPTETVLNGQARTAPFHYNITARARVSRFLGVKIIRETEKTVRWNDYIVAAMAIINQKFSAKPLGRKILHYTPRPFIKLYLYVLKALESF